MSRFRALLVLLSLALPKIAAAQLGGMTFYNGATRLGNATTFKADGTTLTCTIAGPTVTCSAGGGAVETIAQTYAAGASAANQTMTQTLAKGGGVTMNYDGIGTTVTAGLSMTNTSAGDSDSPAIFYLGRQTSDHTLVYYANYFSTLDNSLRWDKSTDGTSWTGLITLSQNGSIKPVTDNTPTLGDSTHRFSTVWSPAYSNSVADGGTAVGFLFNNTASLSTSGAKLFNFTNNGTENVSFTYNAASNATFRIGANSAGGTFGIAFGGNGTSISDGAGALLMNSTTSLRLSYNSASKEIKVDTNGLTTIGNIFPSADNTDTVGKTTNRYATGYFLAINSNSSDLTLQRDANNNILVQNNVIKLNVTGAGQGVSVGSTNLIPLTTNFQALGTIANQWKGVTDSANFGCGRNAQSGTTFTTTATDCNVVMTNSGARTVTLMAATNYQAGAHLYIIDGNNNAGTNNVSVARSGSDTINGGTANVAVVTANSAHSLCVTDGVSAWICGINN